MAYIAQLEKGEKLLVITSDKEFSWKPPLVVDRASKQKVSAIFDEILAVCKQAGLRVRDERESPARYQPM